jgi:DNA polymerase V
VDIVLELNGISCIELEEVSEPRKNICCSRSFGKLITEKTELKEAVANYVCRAAEKLRGDNTAASVLQVFLLTNPFRKNDPQYTPQLTLRLPEPTSYTPTLITHAMNLVDKMFRAGFNYNKAGVLLCDLIPETEVPQDLFVSLENRARKESAIAMVDALNEKFGRNKTQFAAQGFEKDWKVRAEHCSPSFTTNWKDLLEINLNG